MNESDEISNRDLFKRFLGKGGIAAAIKMINAALAYIMTALAARLCSPNDFGLFAILFSTCMTLSLIAPFGQNSVVLRYYPEMSKKFGPASGKAVLLYSAFLTALGQMIPFFTFIILFLTLDLSALRFEYQILLFVSSVVLSFTLSFSEYFSAALRVLGYTFKALAPRDVFWRLAVCMAGGVALQFGLEGKLSVLTVFGLTSLLSVPFLLLQAVYFRNDLRKIPDGSLSAEDKKSVRSAGAYIWGSATLQAVVSQTAIYAVTASLSHKDAGAYFAADRTANLLSLFLMSISLIALPMISVAYARGQTERVKMLSAAVSLLSGAASLCGLVFFYFFGQEILALFNPDYTRYFPVLMIIGFGQCFNALTGPATSFLQIVGAEKPYFYACVALSIVFLSGYFTLTPIYGVNAAAWLSTGMLIAIKIFAWGYGFFKYGYDLTGCTYVVRKIFKR